MSPYTGSLKSVCLALCANAVIAVAKLYAAVYTGSGAMLATATHTLADCCQQALLLWGLRRIRSQTSFDGPPGRGKGVYFWSFILAVLLFSMGGLYAIYAGMHKLSEPEEIAAPWIALGVLAAGFLIESVSLWVCLRAITRARGAQSWLRWLWAGGNGELRVLLGEHLASLLGLMLAATAIFISVLIEHPLFDAMGSIAIGVVLIGMALWAGREIRLLLLGQGADPALRDAMAQHLQADPAVAQVDKLLLLPRGELLLVSTRLSLHAASLSELAAAQLRVQTSLLGAFPQIHTLYIEPAVIESAANEPAP